MDLRQRMEHRQNRRSSDSSAEQYYRTFSGLQHKASPWRADVKGVTQVDTFAQIGSTRPIWLDFHTDSIVLRRAGPRKRVTAKQCRAVVGSLETQHHILTWQSPLQRVTVPALHRQRNDVCRLMLHRRHCKLSKAWRRWMRSCCGCESGIARSCWAFQQGVE